MRLIFETFRCLPVEEAAAAAYGLRCKAAGSKKGDMAVKSSKLSSACWFWLFCPLVGFEPGGPPAAPCKFIIDKQHYTTMMTTMEEITFRNSLIKKSGLCYESGNSLTLNEKAWRSRAQQQQQRPLSSSARVFPLAPTTKTVNGPSCRQSPVRAKSDKGSGNSGEGER